MTTRRNRTRRSHQQQQQQLPHAVVDAFAEAFAQPPSADVVLPDAVQPLPEPPQPATTATAGNLVTLMPPPFPPPATTVQPHRQPRRILSLAEKYHAPLRHLISWRDGLTYDKNHQFSFDELKNITAEDIYRWAKFRVYGDPDADEGVCPPIHYRVNSVLGWKRAISYSMPNNNMQWNEVAKVGNPTRSQQMARLIRHMKRFQTQRRGREPQARRPLTPAEFERLIEVYWKLPNRELGLCAAASSTLQLAMIGRMDDTVKFREPDLRPYALYADYAFCGRLPWSKNVVEERDAPPQVVFASMDTRYDVHSNLGIWLEYHYELYPGENEFVFSYSGLDDPIRIKERMSRLLTDSLADSDFILDRPGLVGTHSIRKLAVTFARGNGCTKVCVAFNIYDLIH